MRRAMLGRYGAADVRIFGVPDRPEYVPPSAEIVDNQANGEL
jgi:hypothetical protein